MKNDFIVLTFKQSQQAFKAWQTLKMIRPIKNILLENGRYLECDRQGKLTVHQNKPLSDPQINTQSRVLDLLVGIISLKDCELELSRLSKIGLDDVFLSDVFKALRPDSSALVFYIPREKLVDTRYLINTLSMFNGTLYQASFPDDVEADILALGETFGIDLNFGIGGEISNAK
jgi:uncharacterized membrane protein